MDSLAGVKISFLAFFLTTANKNGFRTSPKYQKSVMGMMDPECPNRLFPSYSFQSLQFGYSLILNPVINYILNPSYRGGGWKEVVKKDGYIKLHGYPFIYSFPFPNSFPNSNLGFPGRYTCKYSDLSWNRRIRTSYSASPSLSLFLSFLRITLVFQLSHPIQCFS